MSSIIFFVAVFFHLGNFTSGRDTTLYHFWQGTASYYDLKEWNVPKDSLVAINGQYIEEKVDSIGRVTSLKFCFQNKIVPDPLCEFSSWIKFTYPNDSTIVETQFDPSGEFGGNIECDNPTRTIYHYNPKTYRLTNAKTEMLMTERVRKLYLKDTSEKKLNKYIQELNRTIKSPDFIFWYTYSYAKLHGVFPVGKKLTFKKFLSENSDLLTKPEINRIKQTWPQSRAH